MREVATQISSEIKKFANRAETERGATKLGIEALRTAVKKIVKHLAVKDDILEILDFPVTEARPRSEWTSRREGASSDPIQKILAALGTPKKEKTPQELFMYFLSPKSAKAGEICSHCGMTGMPFTLSSLCSLFSFSGHGPATCYKLHPEQRKK